MPEPPAAEQQSVPHPRERQRRLAVETAWVAGIFVALVATLMAVDFVRRQAKDPSEVRAYKELKTRLAANPLDEATKAEIRQLDVALREKFFRQRQFNARGAWLLLAGVVVWLAAWKTAVTVRRQLPAPVVEPLATDYQARVAASSLAAVAVLAGVLVLAAVAFSVYYSTSLPGDAQPGPAELLASGGGAAAEAANPADYAKYWPAFRGPQGRNTSAYANIPEEWDGPSGKGILWKAAVPLPGHSSPVVWANRVFITGADENNRHVYCYDTASGKLAWQANIPGTPQSTAEPPEVFEDTGYAAPTPCTDGTRVYAIFANGDLAALDFSGKLLWTKSLGVPVNTYGHASSPTTYGNNVIVQFDQGDAKDRLSKLIAFDGASGKVVWQTPREIANSWPSPLVISHQGKDQIITAADPWVIAYNAADGAEIWRAKVLTQDVGPSPAYAGGLVYTVSEYPQLSAIRPDGQGDVTASHVVWTAEENLPDTASPLATEKNVFTLASYGYLNCYDAKSGELRWEYEAEDANFAASPALVGDKLYLFDVEGKAWIIQVGEAEGTLVRHCELGEGVVASPALQDGRIYVRGKENLYAIGSQP